MLRCYFQSRKAWLIILLCDYFGKDFSALKRKKLWLFDMDGTICNDGVVIPGTLELLKNIERNHGKYVFITNNSSKSLADYVDYVRTMHINADESNFFTSVQATILYMKKTYSNKRIYCQGTKSFVAELQQSGIDVTTKANAVDVVLVGFDTELTSEKLRNTCEILSRQNVDYIATNPDLVCPVSFGYIPDCGAICKMIAFATGKEPKYMGKPEPIMIQEVCDKYGYEKTDTVVVGDRLYTDIAAGINAGVDSICVLTGEATASEITSSVKKPTYTISSVKKIAELYK